MLPLRITASNWVRILLLLALALLFIVVVQAENSAKDKTYQRELEQLEIENKDTLENYEKKIKKLEQDVKKLKTSKVTSPNKSQTTNVAVNVPVGKEQVAKYIVSKFGSQYAVNVAMCESGLNQYATGSAGERGIFQIHPAHSISMTEHGFTWADMYNWKKNVDYAYLLYSWQSWSPWTCA
jgi:hypothetical protein